MGASSRAAAWLTSIHLASTSPALPAPRTRSPLRLHRLLGANSARSQHIAAVPSAP